MKKIHIYSQPHDGHLFALNGEYIDDDADRLREISKIFSDAADACDAGKSSNQLRDELRARVTQADECEFDPRMPSPQTSNQIIDELGRKNRQLDILQEQVEALTDEISKLRVKYYEGK